MINNLENFKRAMKISEKARQNYENWMKGH